MSALPANLSHPFSSATAWQWHCEQEVGISRDSILSSEFIGYHWPIHQFSLRPPSEQNRSTLKWHLTISRRPRLSRPKVNRPKFVQVTSKPRKVGFVYQNCQYVTVTFKSSIISAVADAVRTSLGPRGMDKMVLRIFHSHQKWIVQSDLNFLDPIG